MSDDTPYSEYMLGRLYGLTAESNWTSWIVAVRYGVKTTLTRWNIAAIHIIVVGLVGLPYRLTTEVTVARSRAWD